MFTVPEDCRLVHGPMASDGTAGNNGAFAIVGPLPGRTLYVVASDGGGWQHISVSVRQGNKPRTPTWDEMCFAKDHFWDGEDVVMQLHPRKSEYINNHPNTLHLWRPTTCNIPEPPSIMVGVK